MLLVLQNETLLFRVKKMMIMMCYNDVHVIDGVGVMFNWKWENALSERCVCIFNSNPLLGHKMMMITMWLDHDVMMMIFNSKWENILSERCVCIFRPLVFRVNIFLYRANTPRGQGNLGRKFLTYSGVILSNISFELEFNLRTNILYCVHVGFKWLHNLFCSARNKLSP